MLHANKPPTGTETGPIEVWLDDHGDVCVETDGSLCYFTAEEMEVLFRFWEQHRPAPVKFREWL